VLEEDSQVAPAGRAYRATLDVARTFTDIAALALDDGGPIVDRSASSYPASGPA